MQNELYVYSGHNEVIISTNKNDIERLYFEDGQGRDLNEYDIEHVIGPVSLSHSQFKINVEKYLT